MVERLIILVIAAIILGIALLAVRLWVQRQLRALQDASSAPLWNALGALPDGRPTIIAFSTPGCAVCQTTQTPALQALEKKLGSSRVRVMKVNAAAHPKIAATFGVLTVPTTVVFSTTGRVSTANHGFAPLETLAEQIEVAATT